VDEKKKVGRRGKKRKKDVSSNVDSNIIGRDSKES